MSETLPTPRDSEHADPLAALRAAVDEYRTPRPITGDLTRDFRLLLDVVEAAAALVDAGARCPARWGGDGDEHSCSHDRAHPGRGHIADEASRCERWAGHPGDHLDVDHGLRWAS